MPENFSNPSEQLYILLDDEKPYVTITSEENETIQSNQFVVDIEFNENIREFDGSNIAITNAVVSGVDSIWLARRFKAYIETENPGTVTLQIPENTVKDIAGNSNNASEIWSIEYLTSIDKNKLKNNDISIYPNPFSNKIRIEIKNEANLIQVEIIDISGKTIYLQELLDNQTSINTSGLLKGIYLIKIISAQNIICSYLIVE